jgi:hypothetical protein
MTYLGYIMTKNDPAMGLERLIEFSTMSNGSTKNAVKAHQLSLTDKDLSIQDGFIDRKVHPFRSCSTSWSF